MDKLLQLLEHLITYGPARNPAERERLVSLLDEFRPQPAPQAVPDQPAPAVPAAPGPNPEVSQ